MRMQDCAFAALGCRAPLSKVLHLGFCCSKRGATGSTIVASRTRHYPSEESRVLLQEHIACTFM